MLDASALLSILLDEPGQARVNQIVDRAQIHAVNLAEVIARLVRAGMPPEKAIEILAGLYLEVDERIRNGAGRVLRHAAGDAPRSRAIARRLRVSDGGGACRERSRSRRTAAGRNWTARRSGTRPSGSSWSGDATTWGSKLTSP